MLRAAQLSATRAQRRVAHPTGSPPEAAPGVEAAGGQILQYMRDVYAPKKTLQFCVLPDRSTGLESQNKSHIISKLLVQSDWYS